MELFFVMIIANKNIKSLKPSATLAINQKVKALREQGETVYHFGFGQSPFPIHQSIVDELKNHANKSSYLPTLGLEPLRKQISIFLKEHQDIEINWEHIFIGPGSKELLYQSILILEGEFLIPKGSWVSYGPQIESKGGKLIVLETKLENNFKLTPNTLEEYCKQSKEQKILILNSPNNPTGAVYRKNELQDLAKICRKYDIIVLSDEIYSQINFTQDHSSSISIFYPEKTIVFGGLSKVFSAGGYRLGFMSLPVDLKELSTTYRSLFSETFSAVAAPIQYAAIEAFKMKPDVKNYIKQCSSTLNTVSQYIYKELTSINIECTQPQGAFYMMIGFENYKTQIHHLEITTSEELANYLLKNYKVALLPASDFYFNENAFFFRLAFVDFEGNKVLSSIEVNKSSGFADNMRINFSNIVKGVNQIKLFINHLT